MHLSKRDPSRDGAPYNPDPRAHPGLHVIALFEAIKGFLALIAASGLAITGPDPVRHFVWTLIRRFNLDARHGIAAGRLIPHGVGPVAPVASNDAEPGRAKNRRVELVKQ